MALEEPRILDTDLAANLGMARPRNIRPHVIDPNRVELETFGPLRSVREQTGGRPATAFYLNEEQALLVCLLSRTERAKTVRAEVIMRREARLGIHGVPEGDLVAASVRRYLDHSPAQSAAG